MTERLQGLIAAACTPFNEDRSLNLQAIPPLVDHLERIGVSGIYIVGSTGEGISLTSDERRRVTEAFIDAVQGRLRTVVHVGHNSLAEARQLAAHAQSIGADIVSATAPSYFPIDNVEALVDSMGEIASGAPNLPFYYYHIPKFTAATIDMVEFLNAAESRIGNLAGIKYTAPTVDEFQACSEFCDGRFDLVWGCDEMLLSALVVGARAGIGSTYNVAAPLYRQIMDAFERGDLRRAKELQGTAVRLVRILLRYPFLAALKFVLGMAGVDCGPCRPPLRSLTNGQETQLRQDLETAAILEWLAVSDTETSLIGSGANGNARRTDPPHGTLRRKDSQSLSISKRPLRGD